MKLFTAAIRKKLLQNGAVSAAARERGDGKVPDFQPVVKLFGGGACTWLLTELEIDGDTLTAFGLCDLGHGSPELGYVDVAELLGLRFPPFGLPIERDLHWTATKTIGQYAEAARAAGRIEA